MEAPARQKKYAFVIDQRKCIGCHACTVACKSENEVPLGKFRTWVKYVDKGKFPAVKRHFTVLRCNHCDAAPCVDICPVSALHKRKDAIVDLNKDYCIGCRACMQACPYDAIYLNDDTGTAEKCHYCAHRTELGLEPACVVVCPERAIVAGDTEDPNSGISKLLASQKTSQRKLEKGTKPRVFYVDALPEALKPGAATEPSQWLWSDRQVQPPPVPEDLAPPEDILTTLNVDHPPVWGWHIWVYLVTKNIAAGAGIVAPFLAMLGVAAGGARDYVPEIVALVFLGVTTFLLIHDLGRPERFWRLLFAPNTKSWLVKGGWFLTAFGAVTTAAIVARWAGMVDVADTLRWVNVPLAVMTSGYSAFLFAQCRGRDLWQSKMLFPNLIVEAIACGTAVSVLLTGAYGGAHVAFALSSVLVLASTMWEWREHGHAQYVQWMEQAGALRKGALYVLAIGLGFMARNSMNAVPGNPVTCSLPAVVGLIWFLLLRARGWVIAGQAVPIS